jgi:hypothetical protein
MRLDLETRRLEQENVSEIVLQTKMDIKLSVDLKGNLEEVQSSG